MGLETLTGMRVKRGQELLRQGAPSDIVYRVVEGRLGLYRDTPAGRSKLYDIEQGAFAGATSVILGRPQIFTVMGEDVIALAKAYRSEDLEHAVQEDATAFPLLVSAILSEWLYLDRRLVDQQVASEGDAGARAASFTRVLGGLRDEIAQALQRVDDPALLRSVVQDMVKRTIDLAEEPSPRAIVESLLWLKVNVTKSAVLRTISSIAEPTERRTAMRDILSNLARATVELSDQVMT